MKNSMIMKSDKQNHRSFKTLWIRFDKENTDKHQLFFKEHSVRNQEPEYPRGRTLFVLNVPPYATAEVLKGCFGKHCGAVSNVSFANQKGFKTSYVVFEDESSLEKALELPEKHAITLNSKDRVCLTGLTNERDVNKVGNHQIVFDLSRSNGVDLYNLIQTVYFVTQNSKILSTLHAHLNPIPMTFLRKWCREYNSSLHSEKEMKEEIESYMQNYDKRIVDKIANERAMEKAEENDGWVTVSGRKKRGEFALSRKESTVNKVHAKEEQKDKKKELRNFYTFQIRESKKQNLAELRKKFELDKKRLQDLKSKRTFKPF